jgi:hypothetical protein
MKWKNFSIKYEKTKENKMILLTMSFVFELPEDFNGTINDALLELIKYRKTHKDNELLDNKPISLPDKIWEGFLAAHEKGYKLHGAVGIHKLKDDNTWEDVEKQEHKNDRNKNSA